MTVLISSISKVLQRHTNGGGTQRQSKSAMVLESIKNHRNDMGTIDDMKNSKDEINERILMRSKALQRRIEVIEKKLEKPLTGFKKKIADFAYPKTERDAKKIDEEAAIRSKDIFPDYFPETLEMMLRQLLNDPESYIKKVEAYEKHCPFPEIDFITSTKEFKTSTKDPMRKMEEACVERALLGLLTREPILKNDGAIFLDLGSGIGRIARLVEHILKDIFKEKKTRITIYGIDLLTLNIEGAQEVSKKLDSRILFDEGDINCLKFGADSISFLTSVATTYLNTKHRRALELAEMARVLNINGISCMVYPNDKFSCREYAYIMLRTAFDRYFNPFNISSMRKFGSRFFYTEKLGKSRPDMRLPKDREMENAIRNSLHANIIDYCSFPKRGGPDVMSSYTFSITKETKTVLRKYIEFREEQLKLDNDKN